MKILRQMRVLILCLLMTVLSIFLFWCSTLKFVNDTGSLILSNLGSVIFISGIFTVIDKYITQRDLVSLITDKVSLKSEIDESGIVKLAQNLGEVEYREYFRNATSNIDILHVYGKTWTSTYMDCIKDSIDRGCNVRVVLLDPESPFADALDKYYKYDSENLCQKISDMDNVWKRIKDEKKGSKGSISLYHHQGYPTNALYRIDDKIIVVNTNSTKYKTTNMPVFIFEKNDDKNNFYNVYLNQIDTLISETNKEPIL